MQVQAVNTQNNQTSFGAKSLSIKDKKLKALTYVVRNRRGYQNDLYKNADNKAIESLKTVGFINTGHTLKYETYSVTDLGDEYYKDIYGKTSYYLQRIVGFINKIFRQKYRGKYKDFESNK